MPSIDVSLAADSKIVVASCYTFRAHQDFVHLLFIAHTGSMAPHSSIAMVYRPTVIRCYANVLEYTTLFGVLSFFTKPGTPRSLYICTPDVGGSMVRASRH